MIFDNILNQEIPWPDIPNDMSIEAQDLIKRYEKSYFPTFTLELFARFVVGKLL